MDNKIKEFVEKLFSEAGKAGFEEYEVYFGSDNSIGVSVREGKVIQYENSDMAALSFRGLYQGQMGYSFTEDFSEEQIPFLLDQAKDNCKVLELKESVTVYEGDKEYPEYSGFSEDLTHLRYEEMANMALELEKKLLAYDSRIEAVDDCCVDYGYAEILIRNSKGMQCFAADNGMGVYVGCRAKENEDVQTYGKTWSFMKRSEFDVDYCAKYVGQHVIAKLGAKPVPSVKTPVVLDKVAARALLASFTGSFSAEAMQKGLSRLAGKVGERIANEKITIIDEGMIGDSPLCIPFDSEGVGAKRTVVVDKGIFVSPLHNRKTALVDGVESTGNGFRGSAKGSLGVSPTNFHLENGNASLEELFTKMGNGIYITSVAGLHAGINGVSGDFSLMAEGFTVENGKIGRPVNQITIADNFFEMLMKIDTLGNDVDYFANDAGHVQAPCLLIPDVSVSGE